MKTHSEFVKKNFDRDYKEYGALIRKLIPKYKEMHELLMDCLNLSKNSKIKILDLGVGTGETALRILKKFPNVEIDGIDISKKMIQQAKIRLKKYISRIKFFEGDMIDFDFTKKYCSAFGVLSIHHLNNHQKQAFFKKIFNCLEENSVFVIADIIKFDTEKETKQKEQGWKEFLLKNLGEKEGNFWFDYYFQEDIPDSVNSQLNWLKEAGFKEIKCIFEHINYAVFYGKK